MYRELGFIRVWGSQATERIGGLEYAYLIYPHRPIVAYAPQTGRLIGEYCVNSLTTPVRTGARGCLTPTTCWRSGWRSPAMSAACWPPPTCICPGARLTPLR